MNNRRTIFISLIFLTVILACAVPGLQTAPPSAPTVDTGILSTMVAETVSAAIVLTEQAFPTSTLVPTTTPTSEPTLIPTAEIVPSGSTLTIQEDGSTLFVDERAGFEITVPAVWLAVRINQQEYRDAQFISPDIYEYLLTTQNYDPNTFRLVVLDGQDGHVINEFFTNTNFIWDELDIVLLKNDDALKARAALLTNTVPGLEILSTKFTTTSNDILVGVIESKSTMKNSSEEDIVVFQKQAIFNAKTGTMTVTVSTVEELKDATFSAFDAMLETIKMNAE